MDAKGIAYFSRRLKELRLANKMTQQHLAEKLGLSRACIANYESSKREPSYATLLELAHMFGVPTDSLLDVEYQARLAREEPDGEKVDMGNYVDISRLSPENKMKVREFVAKLEREEQ